MLLVVVAVGYCFVVGVKTVLGLNTPEETVVLHGAISHYPTYSGGSVYGQRATGNTVAFGGSSFRSARRTSAYSAPAPVSAMGYTSASHSGGASMHVYTTSSASVHAIGGGGGGSAAVGTTSSASSSIPSSTAAMGGIATLAMVTPARASKTAQAVAAYQVAANGSNEYEAVESVVTRSAKARRAGGAGVADCGCDESCGCTEWVSDPEAIGGGHWECTHGGCGHQETCGCPVGGPVVPMLVMVALYLFVIAAKKVLFSGYRNYPLITR